MTAATVPVVMVVNTIIIIVTITAITITAVSSKDKGEGQLGAGGMTKAFTLLKSLVKDLSGHLFLSSGWRLTPLGCL